jgi:hypothetical protein
MIPDIPADGFLADLSPRDQAKVRAAPRGDMFNFCEELNRYGMKALLEMRACARRSVPIEICSLLLYLKALYCLQGAILLLSRGMPVESEILSRTGFECAFELGALAADPAHLALLQARQKLHDETRARCVQELLSGNTVETFGAEIGKAIDEAAAQPNAKDKYVLQQTAVKAGMRGEYDVFYRGISGAAAHATLGALGRHVRQEDAVVRLHIGPDYTQFTVAFASVALFLPLCFRSLAKIFGKPELAEAERRFNAQWGQIIRPLEEHLRAGSGAALLDTSSQA